MAELKDRYAAALFDLSLEEGAPDAHKEQAAYVLEVLKTGQSEPFLMHPHIPNAAKYAFLERLFGDNISSGLMGFLNLAIEKSREAFIIPALSGYIERANRHAGRLSAHVVSATALSEEQLASLAALMSKKLGKQVEVLPRVNPDLIGGFYIHVEGRLIDRTVRTQLSNMKETITRGGAE